MVTWCEAQRPVQQPVVRHAGRTGGAISPCNVVSDAKLRCNVPVPDACAVDSPLHGRCRDMHGNKMLSGHLPDAVLAANPNLELVYVAPTTVGVQPRDNVTRQRGLLRRVCRNMADNQLAMNLTLAASLPNLKFLYVHNFAQQHRSAGSFPWLRPNTCAPVSAQECKLQQSDRHRTPAVGLRTGKPDHCVRAITSDRDRTAMLTATTVTLTGALRTTLACVE